MAGSITERVKAAKEAVPIVSADEAQRMQSEDAALVLDVRDPSELGATGKLAGATNVSRGMLEFRADAESPMHDDAFREERPVIVYCASGGRAALAGQALQELGFKKVFLLGAFKDAAEAGFPVEHA